MQAGATAQLRAGPAERLVQAAREDREAKSVQGAATRRRVAAGSRACRNPAEQAGMVGGWGLVVGWVPAAWLASADWRSTVEPPGQE